MAMAGRNAPNPGSRDEFSALFDAFSKMPPVNSSLPKKVGREDILLRLNAFGKMSSSLLKKMNIPANLFARDEGQFSSDKDVPAYSITHSKFLESYKPGDFPDYSISIGSRGSDVFCTLVDKKRGILVSTSIKSMMAEEGSWDFFEQQLDYALKESGKFTASDKKEGKMIMIVS